MSATRQARSRSRDVAAAAGDTHLRRPPREDIPPELRPALQPVRGLAHPRPGQQPAAQRLGFRFGSPGGGRIRRQQQPRPEFGQCRRHHRPAGPAVELSCVVAGQRGRQRVGELRDQRADRQFRQVDFLARAISSSQSSGPAKPSTDSTGAVSLRGTRGGSSQSDRSGSAASRLGRAGCGAAHGDVVGWAQTRSAAPETARRSPPARARATSRPTRNSSASPPSRPLRLAPSGPRLAAAVSAATWRNSRVVPQCCQSQARDAGIVRRRAAGSRPVPARARAGRTGRPGCGRPGRPRDRGAVPQRRATGRRRSGRRPDSGCAGVAAVAQPAGGSSLPRCDRGRGARG